MQARATRYAIILAGGEGTRFWPASRADRPKQLLPLGSSRPLIRDTVERAERLVDPGHVRVVASQPLVEPLTEAAPSLTPDRFLVEPRPRSTAPALAWAAYELERECPGAVMISLHADHVIDPTSELVRTIDRAVEAAERGSLTCIGVRPDRPETGYGYVEIGESTGESSWKARRFVEKPDRETAKEYLTSGNFLWNSGIFVWRAADLLAAVRAHAPEVSGALPALDEDDPARYFDTVTPVSIDVAVMERARNVEVVLASFAWDDVGSWNALARTRSPDSDGNVIVGSAMAVDARDNVAWSEDGRVVLFDVEGLVVVRTGDVTMVTRRESAHELKRLIARMAAGEE